MTIEMVKQEYANFSPCIYKGEIPCTKCDRYEECDMRQGRELKEKAFIAGWNRGVDIIKAANNDVCEINIYSARVCKYGTKSCVLKHDN